jgi:hypothetical protein
VGLAAAKCVALAWHPDAFLVGIEFGLAGALQIDGTDTSWSYSFSSPSAPCNIQGGTGNEKLQIQVDTAPPSPGIPGISSPGSTCETSVALTNEVDSMVVVPAAVKLIMPSVPAGANVTWTASDPVEAASSANYTMGSPQVWSVMGLWKVAGGDVVETSVLFDAKGTNPMIATFGPCNPTTLMCP